jgi:DNA-binding PadR family transcriptional regulator
VFTRGLNLPRGPERELLHDCDRKYTLRGSESRTLATVGAFRVVSSRDLRDDHERPLDPRSSDLRHLREQRLVETARVPGRREHAVALTREGRSLLERHRDRDQSGRQTFWHGLKRYRDRTDYDGHPDRTDDEIREWAHEHDLPYFDEEVHFPDLRIEYRDRDGREDHEDVEVVTEHYRGAHATSVSQSGFSCYGGSSLRIGGSSGSRGGGGYHGGLAEEMLD